MNLQQSTGAVTEYHDLALADPYVATRRYPSGESLYVCVNQFATPFLTRTSVVDSAGKQDRLLEFLRKVDTLPDRALAYGFERPNRNAQDSAKAILTALVAFAIEPDRVVASAEGGVSVVFYKGGRRATIECLNSGDMVASVSDSASFETPWIVKPTTIYASLAQISAYFAG